MEVACSTPVHQRHMSGYFRTGGRDLLLKSSTLGRSPQDRRRIGRSNRFCQQIFSVAEGCGLKGIVVKTQEELTKAIKDSCIAQNDGITTFIEVILNQELGEPFRRDAMKKPVKVAGINKKDMRPQ